MKTLLIAAFVALTVGNANAQVTSPIAGQALATTSRPNWIEQYDQKFANELARTRAETALHRNGAVAMLPDPAPLDTAHRSVLGMIFNDDPVYNQKLPWYVPAAKIVGSNLVLLGLDRYLFNYDFSHVGFNSWSNNLKNGWEWDQDRFGMNFFVHPYTGGGYFMAARSSGYNYFESLPFALGGSLMWEYFGETTKPSYNDLVNTTFNGAFLGEVAYRLTSNILDDRATGADRAWREITAGLLSPARLVSRLLDGKAFRVTQTDVYEKQAMNVSIAPGADLVNDNAKFGSGPVKFNFGFRLEYGDPLVDIERKPFDHFKITADISNAHGRKLLDNVTGYGLLLGENLQLGSMHTLVGLFQHFDYWDNQSFELGDLAIGPGIVGRLPIADGHNLIAGLHLGLIPLAGNSTQYGPIDTTQQRDYNYGDGGELKAELGFTLFRNLIDVSTAASYIIFHSYVGQPGNNYIGIVKPRIAINVFRNIGVGLEDLIYFSNRTSTTFAGFNLHSSEQKIFVQWTWDDFSNEGPP